MNKPGFVRIIAGYYRSRRLAIPIVKDLRPTPDRVRETLFNWLADYVQGAICLDLFAGSGVLGFEALSRGAQKVIMVDDAKIVLAHLKKMVEQLKIDKVEIYYANLSSTWPVFTDQFDIVFLDPPYKSNLLLSSCFKLENSQCLKNEALIYLEADHEIKDNQLPVNWQIVKQQKMGQVFFHLAKRVK